MALEHRMDFIDLPLTGERMDAKDSGDAFENFDVEDCGECVSICLDEENAGSFNDTWKEFGKVTAQESRPFSRSAQELKLAMVSWMKTEKPELLECEVEQCLRNRNHDVLWTPPATLCTAPTD